MADSLSECEVLSATLAHPGALERALSDAAGAPLIYPLFMTDGWFVRSALPKRLGDAPVHMQAPLGVEPGLPKLVAETLNAALIDRGWDPAMSTLLVASHGSGRSEKSKQATEAFVQSLGSLIGFAGIRTGYVEQDPFFAGSAAGCPDQTLCLPFFAAYGGHVKEDITEVLHEVDFKGVLLDPIGTFPMIPSFIAASLSKAWQSLAPT